MFGYFGGKNQMQRHATTTPVQTVKELGDLAVELGVSASSLLAES